jgi:hypothetical protein
MRLRDLAMPIAAVVLVAGVIGVQVGHGGGSFEPTATADPCAPRAVTTVSTGLEGLGERLVLMGLDNAACTLGTSREALTLAVAQTPATDAQVAALHSGLLSAVSQMEAAGSLPPASSLVDEALAESSLNGFEQAAIRALPDSVIDSALKTPAVLTSTIDNLDLRALLANIDDTSALSAQLNAAVTAAVVAQLKGLL